MNDPNVPIRIEDAIAMVGTCQDMCPRFERYRRERESNLFQWERVRAFSSFFLLGYLKLLCCVLIL